MIFVDDGYRRTQNPQPGDLIVYTDASAGYLHVGLLLSSEALILDPNSKATEFRVLSKLNAWAGELLHLPNDLMPLWPASQGFSVLVEYWTDRDPTTEQR